MKKILSVIIVFSMILSLFSSFGAFASSEVLMENFENGRTWDFTGSGSNDETVKVTTETASEGKCSLLLTDNTDESTAGIASPKVDIEGGKTYTLAVDILNIEATAIKAYLRYSSPSNSKLVNKSVGSKKTGQWERVVITETAPSEIGRAHV